MREYLLRRHEPHINHGCLERPHLIRIRSILTTIDGGSSCPECSPDMRLQARDKPVGETMVILTPDVSTDVACNAQPAI